MANYHVNYLTGSDSTGDGSTGTPWATINHALVTGPVTTGDVVKVVGSTTTDLTTGGTVSTNDRTNEIATPTDLTGSLSVGDIIIVSPNISDGAEFNGWMHTEVQAITSTVLTTRGYWVFPNQTGLSMTITKVNDVIATGTNETVANAQLYTGAVIECGYDATFTSVIGHTYWVNSNAGVGGQSGTYFDINGNGSIGAWNSAMPLFRNVAFCRYRQGIEMAFGQYCYANNIILLNTRASSGDQSFYAGPGTDASTLIYLNDCDGAVLDKNYMQYSRSGDNAIGNMAPMNIFCSQNRDRKMERQGGSIQDLTSYCITGNDFGVSTPFNFSYNFYVTGAISLMGLDSAAYQANYYRLPAVMTGIGQVTPTSWKIVKNGKAASDLPWNYIINNADNAIAGNSYIKLPAGTSIKDAGFYTTGGSTAASSYNAPITLQDDNGLWTTMNSSIFYQQNLVDQEAGNSCLEIYTTAGVTYAGKNTGSTIFSFPAGNAGQRLTGVTFRYKKLSGALSGYNIKTEMAGYMLTLGGINMSQTSWADSTATISSSSQNFIGSLTPNTLVTCFLENTGQNATDTHSALIDSITPIYS